MELGELLAQEPPVAVPTPSLKSAGNSHIPPLKKDVQLKLLLELAYSVQVQVMAPTMLSVTGKACTNILPRIPNNKKPKVDKIKIRFLNCCKKCALVFRVVDLISTFILVSIAHIAIFG